jgi:hypothetical protein
MFSTKILKNLSNLKDMDKDDVLDYLGLESRRSTAETILPAVAMFGVGLLVGAGIGLLLAPKSGAELRNDLKDRISGGPDQLAGKFPSAVGTTSQPVRSP